MGARTRSGWRATSLGACLIALTAVAAAAQTPSPALVVVSTGDKLDGVLMIVDPVAGKIVSRVPVGRDPAGVAVSPDGRLAFVANSNGHGKTRPEGDSISVIDLAARKEIRRVEVGNGARPHDVHVAGNQVYFTATGTRTVGAYDLTRNKVEHFGLGQGGPHMLVVSKDQNTVFAANPNSNNVSVLGNVRQGPVISYPPRPTDWTITNIPVGLAPEGIDISPDGAEVWTANEEGGGVSVINVARKAAQTFDLQTKHANRLRFTPDGRRVLLLDRETGELVVVDAAARKVIRRVKLPGDQPGETMNVGNFAIVPDGSRVYVTVGAEKGGRHYIGEIDLKTLAIVRRIDTDVRPNAVAWVQSRSTS